MRLLSRLTNFVSLITSLVLVLTLAGCSSSAERQAKYLQRAQELYAEADYEKAQLEVKNVLQINPKNSAARVLLAKVFQQKQNFRQAFANFVAAAEDDPNNIAANVELAKIYFLSKQDDLSAEYVDATLRLDPKNKEARIVQASLMARQGKLEQAEHIAQQLLAEFPAETGAIAILVNNHINSEPYKALDIVNQGLAVAPKNEKLKNIKIHVLTYLKDMDGVKSLLQELAEENPQQLTYYYRLAAIFAHDDNPEKVEATLRQAVSNNPDTNAAKFRLVDFINQQRGKQAGIAQMREFMDAAPNNYELREALVRLHLAADQREQAIALLKALIKDDNINADGLRARNSLAEIALLDGDKQSAEAYLEEIFQLEPANVAALITRSRIKLSDSDLKGAIADLRAALKIDSASINALKLLAVAQERDGNATLALDSYIRITELDKNDEAALYHAGRLSLAEGKTENAKLFLQRAVELQPLSLKAVRLLTQILIQQQQWDTAREHVQILIENESTKPAGILLLAQIYRSQDNWQYATGLYHQALELAPSDKEALAGCVDAYLIKSDSAGAIEFLDSHVQKHPTLKFAKNLLAQLYLRINNPNAAIKIYRDLIAAQPNLQLTYQKLAAVYQNQGDYSQAEQTLKEGLENNTSAVTLRLVLASLYEQQRQYELAKGEYEAVVRDQSNLAVAKNNLAMLLVNRFPSAANYSRALALAAEFQDSKNPVFLDTLGWVHYHMNNMPLAIAYLQAAVDRQKDNSEYRYHLGMAYHKNGQDIKAREQLSIALKNVDAKFEGVEQAKAMFDKLQES